MTQTDADLTRNAKDRPDFLVFPPVIIIGTVTLGFIAQSLFPLNVLAQLDRPLRIALGIAVMIGGEVIVVLAVLMLRRLGTNVNPFRPATALAEGGVFSFTRNPIYLGRSLTILGLALVFRADWLMILLVPAIVLLHFAVVLPEERYLMRKFGERYRQYTSCVARYI